MRHYWQSCQVTIISPASRKPARIFTMVPASGYLIVSSSRNGFRPMHPVAYGFTEFVSNDQILAGSVAGSWGAWGG